MKLASPYAEINPELPHNVYISELGKQKESLMCRSNRLTEKLTVYLHNVSILDLQLYLYDQDERTGNEEKCPK